METPRRHAPADETLESWAIGSSEALAWPGTRKAEGWLGRVHSYGFAAGTAAALLRKTERLWAWRGNPPNDPHLIRADGSTWMACITGEDDAWLTLTDDEYQEVQQRPALAALLPTSPDL